jgi:calcineurin-like phosphoesterase
MIIDVLAPFCGACALVHVEMLGGDDELTVSASALGVHGAAPTFSHRILPVATAFIDDLGADANLAQIDDQV